MIQFALALLLVCVSSVSYHVGRDLAKKEDEGLKVQRVLELTDARTELKNCEEERDQALEMYSTCFEACRTIIQKNEQ